MKRTCTKKPDEIGTVYLCCFSEPYKHARHYLGFTAGTLAKRIERHRAGNGARLMAVIKAAGIHASRQTTLAAGYANVGRQPKG